MEVLARFSGETIKYFVIVLILLFPCIYYLHMVETTTWFSVGSLLTGQIINYKDYGSGYMQCSALPHSRQMKVHPGIFMY